MRLLLLNPNATAEMTARIAAEARRHLPAGIVLVCATNPSGPPSIEGAADGEIALPGTLARLRDRDYDAAIIACFDDTGLTEMQAEGRDAVIGLGHAAIGLADLTGRPLAILTTSPASVPVLQANVIAYGLGKNLRTIRASEIAVLDFERDRAGACLHLIEAARQLLADDPAIKVIVLGCAGMGGLSEQMAADLDVLIIDPVGAAMEAAIKRLSSPASVEPLS